MKQVDSLPLDISLKIASYLQVQDLCALSSCSRFWRDLCGSDSIWSPLTRNRWPAVFSSHPIITQGWREVYARMHREMSSGVAAVVGFVERCCLSEESLDVGNYCKAIDDLGSMQLAFMDVQIFLFKPNLSVFLNLVALHYCIFCLQVPAAHLLDALVSSKISERQVSVRWWRLGRWFYGFRMRDESHSRCVSLADLMTDKGGEVLGVLRRGAIHEVLRVQISIPNAASTSWSCQSIQIQD